MHIVKMVGVFIVRCDVYKPFPSFPPSFLKVIAALKYICKTENSKSPKELQ